MWEDGKRFPDEERPKLPWDDEPEKSGKGRKKRSWERFGDVEGERKKLIIFCAFVGVLAAFILEMICYRHIPEALLEQPDVNRRGSWIGFFSWMEIAGGLAGAGVGWVIARLIIGY